MKKLFLLVLCMVAVAVLPAQDVDSVVVVEPGGFRGFYEKYSGVLWTVLGLAGLSAFFWFRLEKVRDALNVLIDAGKDNHVTEAEWQAIATAFKKIWGRKE